MTDFVKLTDLVAAVAEHGPPGWAKLTVMGALYSSRIELYAAEGDLEAFFPAWHLRGNDDTLPDVIRGDRKEAQIIRRYDLHKLELPNRTEVSLWKDEWSDEPKRLALGWFLTAMPFDWTDPKIELDGFEIPRDLDFLFGPDDIFDSSYPDTTPYYRGSFRSLCVTQDDAEGLVPMQPFDSLGFNARLRDGAFARWPSIERGFARADAPLVREMKELRDANPNLSIRAAAEAVVKRAAGAGTEDSKIKRLERRCRGEM